MSHHARVTVLGAVCVGAALILAAGESPEPKIGFDNLGCSDLAIGVFNDVVGGLTDAGAVNVLYGSVADNGLGTTGNQRFTQNSSGMPSGTVADVSEHFGASVVTGDFNHDFFIDLAVGVPNQDVDSQIGAGEVNVLYGGVGGLSTAGSQVLNQSGVLLSDPNPSEHLGDVLAVGDFNGDSFDDLAIGVFGDVVDGVAAAGAVAVVYGSPTGLSTVGNQRWRQGEGLQGVPEANDKFGQGLAAGDFDHDGYDDLAVGVPGEDLSTPTRAGAGVVQIIFGSASGLSDVGDMMLSQDTVLGLGSALAGEGFGEVLATGDFDGDHYADLAVGVYQDSSVTTKAGAVSVAYGFPSGFNLVKSQEWHQDVPNIPQVCENYDYFGRALAVGDFDDNGYDDLAIGVPFEDISPPADNEGVVHVVYGSSTGLTTAGSDYWYQGLGTIPDSAEDQDNFGDALAAGDFNCDGYDDLAIGAPGESLAAIGVGVVHVLPGSVGGLIHIGNQLWSQDNPEILGTADQSDNFGRALAAVSTPYFFADGFESGDTTIWSAASP